MTEAEIDASLLDGVGFLHLDGRNTLYVRACGPFHSHPTSPTQPTNSTNPIQTHRAAIKLAKLARARGIPISLDAEKNRPHLRALVPLCDYLVTNTHFPRLFTGAASTEEGMAALLQLEGGHAQMVWTTLGAEGSMVMARAEALAARGQGDPADAAALPLATATAPYTCPRTGGELSLALFCVPVCLCACVSPCPCTQSTR